MVCGRQSDGVGMCLKHVAVFLPSVSHQVSA